MREFDVPPRRRRRGSRRRGRRRPRRRASSPAAPTSSTTSSSGITAPDVLVDVRGLPLDDSRGRRTRRRAAASAPTSATATSPPTRRSAPGYPVVSRGAAGRRLAARSGTRPPPAATCSSAPAASTSRTSRRRATSASPAPAARRSAGYGRYNAVLGASDDCVAVHPSDLAVALAAVDAVVVVLGADGERRIPLADLHRLPGDRPDLDTTLRPRRADHRRRAARLPGRPAARPTARRATGRRTPSRWSRSPPPSSSTATPSATCASRWGGVAHKPWRATRAEDALRGGPLTEERRPRGRRRASSPTPRPTEQNAYKVPMVRNATDHGADRARRGGAPMTRRAAEQPTTPIEPRSIGTEPAASTASRR